VRCRQEDEIAPHQRYEGLVVHPQEASTTGHHQADAFVAGERKVSRGREFQPTIEAPLGPKQAQHVYEHIHIYSISGVLDEKHGVSCLINPDGLEYYLTHTKTSP
jgi:hypothetical protein